MSYFGRFLQENPEYVAQGVTLAQFSFQIPRPLRQDYVKKKPKLVNPSDEASPIMSKSFQLEEGMYLGINRLVITCQHSAWLLILG